MKDHLTEAGFRAMLKRARLDLVGARGALDVEELPRCTGCDRRKHRNFAEYKLAERLSKIVESIEAVEAQFEKDQERAA